MTVKTMTYSSDMDNCRICTSPSHAVRIVPSYFYIPNTKITWEISAVANDGFTFLVSVLVSACISSTCDS